jgi:hypothetical protein
LKRSSISDQNKIEELKNKKPKGIISTAFNQLLALHPDHEALHATADGPSLARKLGIYTTKLIDRLTATKLYFTNSEIKVDSIWQTVVENNAAKMLHDPTTTAATTTATTSAITTATTSATDARNLAIVKDTLQHILHKDLNLEEIDGFLQNVQRKYNNIFEKLLLLQRHRALLVRCHLCI